MHYIKFRVKNAEALQSLYRQYFKIQNKLLKRTPRTNEILV